jgi:hypothetical protein
VGSEQVGQRDLFFAWSIPASSADTTGALGWQVASMHTSS